METGSDKTGTAFAVETIRAILRSLSEAARAEVIRLVIAPPTQGDERKTIDDALTASGDNITKAAAVLGCSRRTLMVRMRELGYEPRKGGGRRKSLA